jgi:hypothetical protein
LLQLGFKGIELRIGNDRVARVVCLRSLFQGRNKTGDIGYGLCHASYTQKQLGPKQKICNSSLPYRTENTSSSLGCTPGPILASVGKHGTATAGLFGTAQAGDGGEIQLR